MKRIPVVLIAVATSAAAALGVRWALARRGGSSTTTASADTEWTCACGQRFRVTGAGRHRVFWREGAAAGDPVVGDRCPACDRAFPEAT